MAEFIIWTGSTRISQQLLSKDSKCQNTDEATSFDQTKVVNM